jgi:hypothetical protein
MDDERPSNLLKKGRSETFGKNNTNQKPRE